jgi:hypothetical protein
MAPVSIPIRLYCIFHYASYSFRVTSFCRSFVIFVEKKFSTVLEMFSLLTATIHKERERVPRWQRVFIPISKSAFTASRMGEAK